MNIAIDFDGTIVFNCYPSIGTLRPDAKRYINALHAEGHYIIIWTCRTGVRLIEAINFLLSAGIKFDRINSGNPDNIAAYGGEGSKLFADVYIDDRQVGGLPPWKDMYEIISGSSADEVAK